MRWYPMICISDSRHISNAVYASLRESGFITLPSSRTLFDYSHNTKSANGFQSEVIEILKQEAEKRYMYSEKKPWRNCDGILFDDINITADKVYDKYSGELIDYCILDKVGNQILAFENQSKASCYFSQARCHDKTLVVHSLGHCGTLNGGETPAPPRTTASVTTQTSSKLIRKFRAIPASYNVNVGICLLSFYNVLRRRST
ncbi:hypothetical protein FSP39_014589 [Pinctada imbricata]|uniref:Uncharacterized protein n=1 Tax=Pinctada imbricata TaxID=66713 RepID=A0AA88YCR9_PINIB|nr:hypothetical protein FSP39_014589 [Pinctada imbricata]